jgi:hypothetical protein
VYFSKNRAIAASFSILHGYRPRFKVEDNMEFIKKAEQVALECGYRPVELCWMTWLIQPEGRKIRMEKYKDILPKI